MDQQRLWAPWRIGYVSGQTSEGETVPEPAAWQEGAEENCFLCRAAAQYAESEDAQRRNLVVEVGDQIVTLLNRYPYTNGHLLIAPLRHVASLSELTDEQHLAAMHALDRFSQRLANLISAEGFNVGLNLGGVAGAGLPGHLHWHLVPRWTGDNNFMPTVAGARVISQSLETLWEAMVATKGEDK